MPEPRTALSAPINPVTSSSELLDALAVAAVGGVLIGMSGRKTAGSALVRMAGYAMLGLAARPFISAAVRKAGARRRSLATTSTIEIARSVPEVFAFFKDFENFPRVIGSVRSCRSFNSDRRIARSSDRWICWCVSYAGNFQKMETRPCRHPQSLGGYKKWPGRSSSPAKIVSLMRKGNCRV